MSQQHCVGRSHLGYFVETAADEVVSSLRERVAG
jgi:hypothetical protein